MCNLKFKDLKASDEFHSSRDAQCAHCMVPFVEEDELGRCALTDHYTHATCVGHDK
jgi:hypothetical protein